MTQKKHFELTAEFKVNILGIKVFRIRCTKKIREIEIGTLGGFVETTENLSGNAWVYGDAQVYGNAWVYGNAQVSDNAQVYGNAWVYGDAQVYGNAWVYGNAQVYGDARVSCNCDYCCFQSFGSSGRTTTVFREGNDKIKVSCGCFSGTIDEFEQQVKKTHGDNQYACQYNAIINLIKIKFNVKDN